jgi:hypothetical protein
MGIPFCNYQLDGRSNQALDSPEAIIQAGYEVQQSIRAQTNLTPLLSAGWLFHPAWFSLASCPTLAVPINRFDSTNDSYAGQPDRPD